MLRTRRTHRLLPADASTLIAFTLTRVGMLALSGIAGEGCELDGVDRQSVAVDFAGDLHGMPQERLDPFLRRTGHSEDFGVHCDEDRLGASLYALHNALHVTIGCTQVPRPAVGVGKYAVPLFGAGH